MLIAGFGDIISNINAQKPFPVGVGFFRGTIFIFFLIEREWVMKVLKSLRVKCLSKEISFKKKEKYGSPTIITTASF